MKVSLTEATQLTGELQFSAYACLDTTGTREIFDTLLPRLTDEQRRIYAWSMAQLSPATAMQFRGVKVNETERSRALASITERLKETVRAIRSLPAVATVWDGKELETGVCPSPAPGSKAAVPRHKWPRAEKGATPLDPSTMKCRQCGAARERPVLFEPGSSHQVMRLLYELHKAPKQYGKSGTLTADDEALAKVAKRRKALAPLVEHLLTHRDLAKQRGFLDCTLSPAGRYHSSFNVAAAWTGRWSSSKDAFRRGGNLQNITEQHRHIFIPDTGMKIGYADLKTAESMKVAFLSGCESYIEAHKGDVHTYVCRLVWPELPWNGDIKKDKKIASSLLPPWDAVPGHDYRFQSKRVQHGSNFGLTPFGMAIIAHVPVAQCAAAQESYFSAFPEIKDWQKYQISRVSEQLPIYNALRRMVRLLGRPWDGHTHKQGLAFPPQGGVGDILNLGLWRLWSRYEAVPDPIVEVLAQVHDAVLHQYHPRHHDAVRAAIRDAMMFPVEVTDFRGTTREMTIPVEWAVGDNWGKAGPDNPNGLKEIAL